MLNTFTNKNQSKENKKTVINEYEVPIYPISRNNPSTAKCSWSNEEEKYVRNNI